MDGIDGGKVEKSTKYLFTKFQIFDQSTSSAWKYQFENQISFCRAEMAVATANATALLIFRLVYTRIVRAKRSVWKCFHFTFRRIMFMCMEQYV